MSSIIWNFSKILKAIEPYGERKKKKIEKKNEKWKKKSLSRKNLETNSQLYFIELLITVEHAAINISSFLIVSELWQFFYFL